MANLFRVSYFLVLQGLLPATLEYTNHQPVVLIAIERFPRFGSY